MTTPSSFSEEECFTVYWTIENFSFCRGTIDSPEFIFSGRWYFLRLSILYGVINCRFLRFPSGQQDELAQHISFVTRDGTLGLSISGCNQVYLKVARDVICGKRRNSFLPDDVLTVRFLSPTSSEKEKLIICSQIGVIRRCFLWAQKDFSNRSKFLEKHIVNRQRYGDLKLTLTLMDDELIFFEISRESGKRFYCTFNVSILDANGKSVNEVSYESLFEKDGQNFKELLFFVEKSRLLSNSDLLLPNNTLTLKCNLTMSLGSLTDQTSFTSYCKDYKSLVRKYDDESERKDRVSCATLQTDLKNILDDGTLFDGTLQIDTEVIKIHKNILSARSPVFKSMFTQNMKEAIDGNVVIEDLDVATVRRLLLYIYTDSVQDGEWEDIKKLYFAADKYDVPSLKKKCASLLKTKLSVSNVCEALVLADLYRDRDLKSVALGFISMNDTAVFIAEQWKELEMYNSPLAVEVMREIYCNKIHILR